MSACFRIAQLDSTQRVPQWTLRLQQLASIQIDLTSRGFVIKCPYLRPISQSKLKWKTSETDTVYLNSQVYEYIKVL